MNALDRAAALLALVDSLLVLYAFYSPGFTLFSAAMMAVGAALLVVSLVCLYGVRLAFYVSASLSLLVVLLAFFGGVDFSGVPALVLVISLVSVVVNALVARSTSLMPEQGNPMNLPVFG